MHRRLSLDIEIHGDNVGAFPCQTDADALADALRRSGHDRDFAFQSHGFAPFHT
jgi:hypothetical protein